VIQIYGSMLSSSQGEHCKTLPTWGVIFRQFPPVYCHSHLYRMVPRMRHVRNSPKVLMPSSHFRFPRLTAPMSLAREVEYSQLLQSAPGGKGVHGTNTFTRNTLLHSCVNIAIASHRRTRHDLEKERCFSGLTVKLHKPMQTQRWRYTLVILGLKPMRRVQYSIMPSTSSNAMLSSTRKIQKQNDFSVDLTFISE